MDVELPTHQSSESPHPSRKLLIFGQGPIIDTESRIKAEEAGTSPGNEDMNFWGHGLADAGSTLYQRGVVNEIIIMGGRTGGKHETGEYASEAEILSNQLEADGVPKEAIRREQRSTNTLENLLFVCEEYLDADNSSDGELDILGTNYHSPRLRLLMDLFAIPYKRAFSADEVRKATAYEIGDIASPVLNDIDKRLDLNTSTRQFWSLHDTRVMQESFYYNQKGTEKKDIAVRLVEEDMFSRMLLEVPEYWMTYVGKIKSDRRLEAVLANITMLFPGYLEGLGIKNEEDVSLQRAREILSAIPRPNIAQWIENHKNEDWPDETKQKLERFVEARRSA